MTIDRVSNVGGVLNKGHHRNICTFVNNEILDLALEKNDRVATCVNRDRRIFHVIAMNGILEADTLANEELRLG